MGTTFEIAKEYVQSGTITNTFYLSQFPNNVMMASVEIVFLKMLSIFGVKDYLTAITVINAIVVSATVILSFYTTKKISNKRNALMFLFICLFTTPFYLYSAEYYTDTFSMIISVLLLYIWLFIREKKNGLLKRVIIDLVYAFVLFIGIKLKLTSAFVFIASVVYEIVQLNLKTLAKNLVVILPVTVLFIIVFNNTVVNKFALPEKRFLNEIPKEHWIMMGMNGVGSFSFDEYAYTNSYKTYPEKQQAARDKIKERLKEREMSTHVRNITYKLGFAWHDGTYYAPVVLRNEPVTRGVIHETVFENGKNALYYKYIPQTMHFAMLIFIIFNIIRIIKEKDYESKDIITITTMFGVMLFLILWENRSRYLVNILPLMIMSQINGIDKFSKYLESSIKEWKFNSKKGLLPSDCERKAE